MAHAFSAYLAPGNLYTALVADNTLVADTLVLAAVALEVLLRPKDLLAEEAVFFILQRPVVYRLRLRHLPIGPRPDLLR